MTIEISKKKLNEILETLEGFQNNEFNGDITPSDNPELNLIIEK